MQLIVEFGVFYGQAAIYAALLVTMISRYQARAKQTLSSYNPDIFRWLWTLVGLMVAIWGLKVLVIFTGSAPMLNMLADWLLVVMIYLVAVVQWRNPSLFYIQQLSTQLAQPKMPQHKHPSDGLLDQDTRASIFQVVQGQVKDQALYRDSQLTLATLAEKVGVSVHHLSEALNQCGGKNFNVFINEYRVAEVCEQLNNLSERKLIDLALDAGFSSKSSFNATFKKLTGQTPGEYRSQQRFELEQV